MNKEAKVHMLPTDRSYLTISGGKLSYDDVDYAESGFIKPQHLYILSDEEIKEGDWFMNVHSNSNYIDTKELFMNVCDYFRSYYPDSGLRLYKLCGQFCNDIDKEKINEK